MKKNKDAENNKIHVIFVINGLIELKEEMKKMSDDEKNCKTKPNSRYC